MDRTKDYHVKENDGLTKTNVEIFSYMEVNTNKKKQKQKRHYWEVCICGRAVRGAKDKNGGRMNTNKVHDAEAWKSYKTYHFVNYMLSFSDWVLLT